MQSGFRCQFCDGSLMMIHYPKLCNMARALSLSVLTAFKGTNFKFIFYLYAACFGESFCAYLLSMSLDDFKVG